MISVCVGATRGSTVVDLALSIVKQTYSDWELILIAQGGDPVLLDACREAEQRDRRIRVIRMSRRGRSAALNRGIAEARGEIIAFTDDDCEAAPDWLDVISDCFQREPAVGLVAGDLLPPPVRGIHISVCPATRTIECLYDPKASGFAGPPGFYWGGANFAVRREVIDRIGLLDETLGTGTDFASAEDVDFGLRAEEQGIVMWTTPRSVIYHTSGRRNGLPAVLRHLQAYARGQGGLGAKLSMWNYRPAGQWGRPEPRPVTQVLKLLVNSRGRHLIQMYQERYIRRAFDEYIARYELGPDCLARPRSPIQRDLIAN